MRRGLAVHFLHHAVYLGQNFGVCNELFVVSIVNAVFSRPEVQSLEIGNNDGRCEFLIFADDYAVLYDIT